MWLTDGFLVTFFGKWWGAVHIHVSHVQLPYTVHRTRWTHVWWWGQYTHTCVPTATVQGVLYTVNSCVEGAFTCGSYSHVEGPFTCGSYSCVERHSRVEGTFTCGSYSCVGEAFTCGGDIHVWELFTCGEAFTCGGHIHVWRGHSHVGVIHVWRGHSRVGAIHVWRRHSRVGAIHMWRGHSVWELFTCGGDIHVWEAFTCGSYSRVEQATKVKFFTPWYFLLQSEFGSKERLNIFCRKDNHCKTLYEPVRFGYASGRVQRSTHLPIFFLHFQDTSPFCGATDTLVLDFWWCLPWVSKPVPCLCAFSPVYNGFLRFTSGATSANTFIC